MENMGEQSKLDGQKVWVKNMNKLTKAEKSWEVSLANCDIHGDLQKEYAGFYKGKIAVVTYNKKTFKSFNKFKNICVIVFLKCYKVCYNLATRW